MAYTITGDAIADLAPYGVRGISIGGCIEGITNGRQGAFRRKAHAHCEPKYEADWLGWICIRAERRLRTAAGRWSELVWHEVGHIWRRSWTEAQCDAWARKQVRLA